MAGKKTKLATAKSPKHGGVLTVFFVILSILWIAPMLIVLMKMLFIM